MNTTLKMRIVLRSNKVAGEAAGKPAATDEALATAVKALATPSARSLGGSTEAKEFLAMRARQKAAEARARRRVWMGLGVGAVAALGGAFALFQSQDGAIAAQARLAAPALATVSAPVAVERAAPEAVPALVPAAVEAPAVNEAPAVTAEAPAVPSVATTGEQTRCADEFNARNWKAAADSCALAFEQTPDPTVALRIAHAQYARDNVPRAGAWASKAVDLGTTDPDAYVLIGHAEREAGHLKSALTAYRRYLQASPQGWHARDVRSAVRGLKARLAELTPTAPVAATQP